MKIAAAKGDGTGPEMMKAVTDIEAAHVPLEHEYKTIIGVDMIIESAEQPQTEAKKCLRHIQEAFSLVIISNRGTLVCPKDQSLQTWSSGTAASVKALEKSPLCRQISSNSIAS